MKKFLKVMAFAALMASACSCGTYYGLGRIEKIDRETQQQIDKAAARGRERIERIYQRYPNTPPQHPATMQPWQLMYPPQYSAPGKRLPYRQD